MATIEYTPLQAAPIATPSPRRAGSETSTPPRMHRVRTVRLQQGVSLRSAARQSGTDIRQLRLQEQESTDLRLSDLHKWQKALDVPLTELLEEPDTGLSAPVMERARMVRLMKTAAAIQEQSPTPGIRRMATMLMEQLTDVMPELADVSPWHTYGQRRSLDEYGRVFEQRVADEMISGD